MNTMENGWVCSSLETLTSLIKDGSHGTHKDVTDGVPFLSAKDVRDGALEIPNDCRRISEADYASIHKSYEIAPNDILLTVVGTIGRCYLMTGQEPRFSIQRSVAVIRPYGVQPEYLYHFFRSLAFQTNLKDFTNASAQGGVYLGSLAKCSVTFPTSNDEQSQIATILSTIDEAIEQTEEIIAKKQRIKTGLMQDLLTRGIDEHGNIRSEQTHQFKDSLFGRIPAKWEEKEIGKVAALQRGYDITENQLIPGPYPVISSSGIVGYHNVCTSVGPNVLVGRKGSIGNVHYVEGNFWAHDTSLFVTDFFGNCEKYVYYLFTYLDLARLGTKSGSPSLNRNDIHPVVVGVPGREEQREITRMLAFCDESLLVLNNELKKAKRLKTGLMQDLLTGKVRVTELPRQQSIHPNAR